MVNTGIGFAGKYYMQDVNKSVCDDSAITIGTSGRLVDKRDGKVYWVTKLNDGLCWMTQNLDLDLTEAGLTAALSDMDSDWNQNSASENPSRTAPTKTLTASELNTTSWPNSGPDDVRSYDPGFYIFNNGTTKPADTDTADAGLLIDPQYGLAYLGWTKTYNEGFIGASQYVGSDNQTVCNKKAGSKVGDLGSSDVACRVYYYDYFDATFDYSQNHYAQGNYYTFNAATAGSGKNKTTNDTTGSDPATDSICPKGWKLPLSGSGNGLNTSAKLGTFGRMINSQLNITSTSTADTNLLKSPLYFVRGGRVDNGSLYHAGSSGFYWPSTSYSSTAAYTLTFANNGVNPFASGTRYYGSSVRCVAR